VSILQNKDDASRLGHFTTLLRQKAHSRLTIMARGCLARSRMFLNLLLFTQLRATCDSQTYSCDTATFVLTHPSEAI